MNNPESQKIVARFFEALNVLVQMRALRGKKTFCDLYEIDRRNFHRIDQNNKSRSFQVGWLVYLCRDFDVSAQWLLTGNGPMFKRQAKNDIHPKK